MSHAYFLPIVKPFSLRSGNSSDGETWRVLVFLLWLEVKFIFLRHLSECFLYSFTNTLISLSPSLCCHQSNWNTWIEICKTNHFIPVDVTKTAVTVWSSWFVYMNNVGLNPRSWNHQISRCSSMCGLLEALSVCSSRSDLRAAASPWCSLAVSRHAGVGAAEEESDRKLNRTAEQRAAEEGL